MTNYNDGNWHGWNGGECPVHPKTVVDVILNNYPPVAAGMAGEWCWDHDELLSIIAFRVVKEYREPREWWVNIYEGDGTGLAYTSRDEADRHASRAWVEHNECIKVREVLDDE